MDFRFPKSVPAARPLKEIIFGSSIFILSEVVGNTDFLAPYTLYIKIVIMVIAVNGMVSTIPHPYAQAIKVIFSKNSLAGVLDRSFSYILDIILLAFFGYTMVKLFPDTFNQLAQKGWWIGIVIWFAYFGVMQSFYGRGQTIGQIVTGIRVIKEDGSLLNMKDSLLRTFFLSFLPFGILYQYNRSIFFPSLNGLIVNLIEIMFGLSAILWAIISIPLHPYKQGLQDFAVNSIVVKKEQFSESEISQLKNPKKAKTLFRIIVILLGIGFIIIAALGFFGLKLENNVTGLEFKDWEKIQDAFENTTLFENISLRFPSNKVKTDIKKHNIEVSVWLPETHFENSALLNLELEKAIDIIIRNIPKADEFRSVILKVETGVNIGIYKSNKRQSITYAIASEKNKRRIP